MVQYHRIRETTTLLANNNNNNSQQKPINNLILISIGTPEKGTELFQHLNIPNGSKWIFVDPTNTLYDKLHLNTTFLSPQTAYTFRDRILGMNSNTNDLRDLFDVLSKWKDAIYIPPKMDQAFQQGGAFIFDHDHDNDDNDDGGKMVFAHYDASTGDHIAPDDFVKIAIAISKEKKVVVS
jgi:hypothetical protein